ncbi:MAG: urease accessory protein UreF [Pseudomonadota bacterium]
MATDSQALQRLLAWLSPSFPVGAFTFSHALEQAIEAKLVCDAASSQAWLVPLLRHGSGQADLVFVCAGWRCEHADVQAWSELALAMAGTQELRLEMTAQGDAFIAAIDAAWPCDASRQLAALAPGAIAYPVAVGHLAQAHGVELEACVTAYAHAFVANLVSAIVRALPLGQTDGQRVLAGMEESVSDAVVRAMAADPDAVTASTPYSDLCSMQHEHQYSRLFRS